jgi:beta-N-acetylhexosaminidase
MGLALTPHGLESNDMHHIYVREGRASVDDSEAGKMVRSLLAAAVLLLTAAPARATQIPSLKSLSVEELVGQTFMIAIDTDIAIAREADVRAGRLGGGMLRWDRFSADEARALSEKLREWSAASPHEIPFWLSTDHEGGPTFTQRRYGVAPFPGSMALGAAGSTELARASAEATARELRALGVSITFAPSLDVNSNPSNPIIGLRSYGQDPALVTRLGLAALQGYRDGGILAVPKHFPGHGDTSDDSHTGLPVSTKTLAALESTELVPFRAAIKAGAEAIMPAHMVFPALGAPAGRPVTLSSAVIGGFLRGELGFEGLVFSDSLDMGAILNVYGSSESAVLALLAGNDVLLIGKGDYPSSFSAVVEAVKSGRMPRARVEESVARILEAKRRLGLFSAAAPRRLSPETLARDRALAQRVADEAVTLVRNDGVVPLKLTETQTLSLILFHSPRYADEAARFAAAVAKRHPLTEVFDLPLSPSAAAVAGVLARSRTAAAVVAGTYQFGTPVPAAQAGLVHALIAGPTPVVAVSLMNPYDLALSSGARAAICAYGMTDSSLESVARLLFGELKPRGRLPVDVPKL